MKRKVSAILAVCLIPLMASRAEGEFGPIWYYDTVTGQYFEDELWKIPPFTSPGGHPAVRAHFFTCGDCFEEERFLGYYEKYTDEVKEELEEMRPNFMEIEMSSAGRLYSTDGETWVLAQSQEGLDIIQRLMARCPSKKLRYCPPEAEWDDAARIHETWTSRIVAAGWVLTAIVAASVAARRRRAFIARHRRA